MSQGRRAGVAPRPRRRPALRHRLAGARAHGARLRPRHPPAALPRRRRRRVGHGPHLLRALGRRGASPRARPTPDDLLLLPEPAPAERADRAHARPRARGGPSSRRWRSSTPSWSTGCAALTEGERFKQARAKMRRRVATEESRLEEALKDAARELGLELQRTDDEVQITAARRGRRARRAATRSRPSPPAIEEFETRLANVQDEADAELRGVVQHLLGETVKSCFLPVRTRFEGASAIVAFLGRRRGRRHARAAPPRRRAARRRGALALARRRRPDAAHRAQAGLGRARRRGARTRRSPRSSAAPTRRPTPTSRPSRASPSPARCTRRTAAS